MPIRTLLARSRSRLVISVLTLTFVTSLSTRLVLLAIDPNVAGNGPGALLRAFGAGALLDLEAALWVAMPWVLYLWLLPERWFHSRPQRVLIYAGFLAALVGALFVGVAESFFYEEFSGRFNFVAVDYLLFPNEVAGNIWESYHTGIWLTTILLGAVGLLLLLHRGLSQAWMERTSWRLRTGWALAYLLVLSSVTLLVPSSLAHVSDDRALNEVAANGYRTFWEALLGRDAPYAGWYAQANNDQLATRLAGLVAEPTAQPLAANSTANSTAAPSWTLRRVVPPGPPRRLNVVVVLEESFGSEFVGALHPEIETRTPRFDELAREGTLLTHAYSTGNRTIRAIEATTSSLPPLPGISIVRREQSKNLFTLPAILAQRGYQTLFVYGGRAMFDGMAGYLRANGIERIVEQGDFPSNSFKTAWGVADELIFDRALCEFDAMEATGRPFYSLVLTVSNHRPFTFPEGRIERRQGFHRRDHAVAYADYALGRFIREARQHPFFDHTLFVLMGDHGARVYGAQQIPLASYEVPILFYGPGIVPAGARLETLASSLDIPPTVLSLLGEPYNSKFFGHDLWTIPATAGRALMTHNSDIALLRGGELAVLGLHQSTRLLRLDPQTGKLLPVAVPDSRGKALIADAIATFDGADRMYRSGAYSFEPRNQLASRPAP